MHSQTMSYDSSAELRLANLDFYLVITSKLNVFLVSLLTFVGIIGNLVTLLTIVRSNKSLPEIVCKHYFILLVIANPLFLVTNWNFITLSHINFNYKFFQSWNYVHTNRIMCKLTVFLRHSSHSLSALSTMAFSIERYYFIVHPLKAISYKNSLIRK